MILIFLFQIKLCWISLDYWNIYLYEIKIPPVRAAVVAKTQITLVEPDVELSVSYNMIVEVGVTAGQEADGYAYPFAWVLIPRMIPGWAGIVILSQTVVPAGMQIFTLSTQEAPAYLVNDAQQAPFAEHAWVESQPDM